jgi:glutathione S-transferase
MITISAFKLAPAIVHGLVRDLRLRWALEEAGLPYRTKLLALGEHKQPAYRALQPFGQIPIFEEDGLELFESGSIVLHIGERSEVLLPKDAAGRARATMWLLCALNTMEWPIWDYTRTKVFNADQEWAKLHLPDAEKFVAMRLSELAAVLGDREYLEDRFTCGDLMMTAVLRILRDTDILDKEPTLKAYRDRCEARPAFQRALRDHLADFQN